MHSDCRMKPSLKGKTSNNSHTRCLTVVSVALVFVASVVVDSFALVAVEFAASAVVDFVACVIVASVAVFFCCVCFCCFSC